MKTRAEVEAEIASLRNLVPGAALVDASLMPRAASSTASSSQILVEVHAYQALEYGPASGAPVEKKTNTMKRTHSLFVVLVACAAGCVEPNDAVEEQDLTPRDSQSVASDGGAPCVIFTEPTWVLRSEPSEDVLVTSVENHRNVGGMVRLTATVFSEHGDETMHDFASAQVDAQRTSLVELPIDGLKLPRTQGALPRNLQITGEIEYEDGIRETADVPVHLFFHTDESGALRIYDRTRAHQLSEAALRGDEAFSGLRSVHGAEPGGTVGVAYVDPQPRPPDFQPSMDVAESESSTNAIDALVSDAAPVGTGIKICIRQYTTFTDAGVGEDYWTTNYSYPRYSLGTTALIVHNQSVVFFDQLGDGLGFSDPGSGCTPVLSSGTGTYTITLFSAGEVRSHPVSAAELATGTIVSHSVNVNLPYDTNYVNINAAAQYDEFNVYMAGAYSVYRHDGGASPQSYEYAIHGGSSRYLKPEIEIMTSHEFKKFVIGHETGHALADNNFSALSKLVTHDCSFSSGSCPSPTGEVHAMTSKEWSNCAAGEGFAHFYSADVFNSDAQTDCKFHYYKAFGGDPTPLVDCEFANGAFDVQFLESNCLPSYTGMGVELDWMRTFWDVHTNGASPPSFDNMIQWIESSNTWEHDEAYLELDAEAQQVGGSLMSNWNGAAPANGIDW